MDGGVRQGTDVLKALAMGAKAVFVGRPVLWGLAYKVSEHSEGYIVELAWHCGPAPFSVQSQSGYVEASRTLFHSSLAVVPSLQGSEGVEQVLQILKDEFKLAMMLSGR